MSFSRTDTRAGLLTIPILSNYVQVEGEAQGEENAMKQFLADVDKGPPHASVVKLEKHTRDLVDGETEFEVRR